MAQIVFFLIDQINHRDLRAASTHSKLPAIARKTYVVYALAALDGRYTLALSPVPALIARLSAIVSIIVIIYTSREDFGFVASASACSDHRAAWRELSTVEHLWMMFSAAIIMASVATSIVDVIRCC